MKRIVLDTNVVFSSLLQPFGPPAQIFLLALGGSLTFCITGEIFAECEEVIHRPRFCFDAAIVTAALQAIRAKALRVRPTERVRSCPDPDDDIFLECAQAARAPYLVTGNPKHFPSVWRDTQIVTPANSSKSLRAKPNPKGRAREGQRVKKARFDITGGPLA